ncbi:MAG: dihydrofolate reductase [Gammaproteobacteria bacterium]|nr:dihydrofolate reductase [Gammaproteobacteria bacterium]
MHNISLVVAVDEKMGIGRGQQLLCHLPEDLAFFKQQTMSKPLIMGRRTYQSIGRPLPGRRSIVLSKDSLGIPGVEMAHTLEQALELCAAAPEVMVIGGSSVYAQFLPLAQRIYLTSIHHSFAADVFFPEFDAKLWKVTILKEFASDEKNKYDLTFMCYEKVGAV